VIRAAIARIFPTASELVGASRTDSGVHARGMVAHFDVPAEARLTAGRLVAALNALLPEDIRVLSAARTCGAFHARFGATSKQYRYQIWNHPVMNPLLLRRAWHVPQPLDLVAMREAARLLVGRHDFRAFTSRRDGELGDSCRTMRRCEIRRAGPLLTVVLEADGFLYKMCRGITGTLVQAGRGKLSPGAMAGLCADPAARRPGLNAPSHGLVLWKVSYARVLERNHPLAAVAAKG
jgi:tRNA pseudouridine38-40 synthase